MGAWILDTAPPRNSPPCSSNHNFLHITYSLVDIYVKFPNTFKSTFMHAKSLQSCPTLGDPTVCSLPGSSVHRLLQARILEGAAMPSSRESFPTQKSNPRFLHFLIWQVGSLPLAPPGKTYYEYTSTLSPGYNTCNSC